jgi:hypothetical protein
VADLYTTGVGQANDRSQTSSIFPQSKTQRHRGTPQVRRFADRFNSFGDELGQVFEDAFGDFGVVLM